MSCSGSHECFYLDVLPSGRLHSIFMEDDVVTQGSMLHIHILWKDSKKWMLNPHLNDEILYLKCGFMRINPLITFYGIQVSGNSKSYWRREAILGKQIPFFQYSIKMGRELLRRNLVVVLATYKFWRFGNV